MVETAEKKQATDFAKVPRAWPLGVAVVMFGAAVWGGGEMARAEIAQRQLDSITAKGHVVRATVSVPSGAVLTPDMLELVDTYANRVEPYCFNRVTPVVGKKTRYGLEGGQVLTVKDLE